MGMGLGSAGGPKSEINVTPLVDVVLVLLIIFMVVQPLLQMGYDVQVPPNAENQPPTPPTDQIVITVTGAKEVYLNKEKVDLPGLPVRIQEVLKNRGSKVVFFSVEDTVNYADAMQVMDVVRNNGAKNIGIVMDFMHPLGASAPGAAPGAAP